MFAVLMYWWVRSLSRGTNNLYVYEPQHKLGRGKTDLTPSPPPPLISDLPKAVLLLWFILIVNVHPLYDLSLTLWSFYLGYPDGLLLRKRFPLGFPHMLLLFYAVLIVCISLPLGVWGRMWNLIVSVPDHCPFFYLVHLFRRGCWGEANAGDLRG